MSVIRAFALFIQVFPAPIQLFVLGVVAYYVIRAVFKIVAMVLDAIPFL